MVNSVRDHYPDATYTGFCEKSPVYHRRTKFKKASVPVPPPVPVAGHGQSLGPPLAPQTRINKTQAPAQHSRLPQFTMQFPQQSPDSQLPFFSQPISTHSVSNQSNSSPLDPLKTITMSGVQLLTQQQSNILLVGQVPHKEQQQQTSGDETGDSSVGAPACKLPIQPNNP